MNLEKYDINVQKLISSIEQKRYQDLSEQVRLCQKLYDISQKEEDNELSGFACYCFGDMYFENKEAKKGFAYLSRGIHYLSQTQEWEITCRSYNELALLLQYQGNFVNAMDCFFTGVEIAEEHHLDILAGVLYQNFSSLCETTGDYERALFYRKQSQDCLSRCEKSEKKVEYQIAVVAMLLRLYIKLEMVDKAGRVAEDIEEQLKKYPQYNTSLDILVNKLKFAHVMGRAEESTLKDKTVEAFYTCTNIVKYFDECITLVNYLKDINDLQLMESVLNCMEQAVEHSAYAELYMQVIQYRIGMYEILGRKEELSEAAYQYFKLSCRQKEEMQRSVSSVLNLKITLKQAEINNMFLSAKADMDALTGIPNRRKLNEDADRLFDKAALEKKHLGFEMLDIDFFKKYNDDHGHHMGDQCIIRLASALQEQNDPNQTCYRYGGDEFFIIYFDLDDEEIFERCRKLRERVAQIGTALGLQSFTISQGIANWVPKDINRVWDYTSAADEALYWVKNQGRDDIRLIHSVSEIIEEEKNALHHL